MKIRGEYLVCDGVVKGIEDSNIDMKCQRKVYEVIRIIDGKPLFFKEHIERMHESIKMTYKEEAKEVKEKFFARTLCSLEKCIDKNGYKEGNIQVLYYIQSRRVMEFLYFIPHSYPSKRDYEEGVKSTFIEVERENPEAKVLNLDYKKEVKKILDKVNAYEGILVDRYGCVTEGSRSNLFFVKKGVVLTTGSRKVLQGITRMKVLQVIKDSGIKLEVKDITKNEVLSMDGIFMTGTSPEVLSIKSVDNHSLKSARVEEIKTILKLYRELCEKNLKKFSWK